MSSFWGVASSQFWLIFFPDDKILTCSYTILRENIGCSEL